MTLRLSYTQAFLVACILLVLLPSPAAAFGAGNIPSISQIEGKNWRHGDIEDTLKTIAFLHGHKWSTLNVKRVYFGNWLRDYSQAVDVGSLKGVSAPVIRILVWILGFMSFGYATAEFEVTAERLGVYRPEEHIDNPKDYADNVDARQYDPRLRGPVRPIELEVDAETGMKNYIANDRGDWATSTGYIRHSLARCIHFGRLYTHGSGGTSGKEADLYEALRCLGQALHCLEDFGAHTNYCELALRELGHHNVFAHVGIATEINLRGRRVFPLVTGTFGAVDFLHSVLGEMTDHFTQSEVDELDTALKSAEQSSKSGTNDRGLFGSSSGDARGIVGLLAQLPGVGPGLADQARSLEASSMEQEYENTRADPVQQGYPAPIAGPGNTVPGMSADFDAEKTAARIYPILEFRDRIVKAINVTIAKIPGLESLVERISETLTLFIMSLLAPFVTPIIKAVSASLKQGSSTVVNASANQQFEPWNNPHSTNPTHSMLSKDHFSNFLNSCAGRVAATILQYTVPRVLYAWEHPGVPVDQVTSDVLRAFHHPAIRDEHIEIQRNMFHTVRQWAEEPQVRDKIDRLLNSDAVKDGRNHMGQSNKNHSHGAFGGHSKNANSIWSEIRNRDLDEMHEGTIGSTPSPRPSQTPDYGYSSTNKPPYPGEGSTHLRSDHSTGHGSNQDYYQGAPPADYYPGQNQPVAPYPHQHGPPQGQPGGYWQASGPGYPTGPPQYGGPSPGPGYPQGPPHQYGGPPPAAYGQPPYGAPPGPYGPPYPTQPWDQPPPGGYQY